MKIKKSITLFLAVLLLISNMGLAFNVHYCGEQIASISLNSVIASRQFEKCCVKNEILKENCCKDKVVNCQKKLDNLILKVFSFSTPFYFVINEKQQFKSLASENFECFHATSYFCDSNAPPFFKLYRQYIFYA